MEVAPVCLLLSCLRVSPDSSQLFRYSSLSLTCTDPLNSTVWRVKRKTSDGGLKPCSSGWGLAATGSRCTIGNAYSSDSGVYWCESRDGERSDSVNITVTDGSVILESPVLPVMEGRDVTLRCKTKTTPSSHTADFYKDGVFIGSSSTGETTIHSVSKSDEGFYKCSVSDSEESPESWLAVRRAIVLPSPTLTPTPTPTPAPSPSPSPSPAPLLSVPRLVCHLVVGIPYLVSTVVLGLICRDRKRARTHVKRRGSDGVVMETAV